MACMRYLAEGAQDGGVRRRLMSSRSSCEPITEMRMHTPGRGRVVRERAAVVFLTGGITGSFDLTCAIRRKRTRTWSRTDVDEHARLRCNCRGDGAETDGRPQQRSTRSARPRAAERTEAPAYTGIPRARPVNSRVPSSQPQGTSSLVRSDDGRRGGSSPLARRAEDIGDALGDPAVVGNVQPRRRRRSPIESRLRGALTHRPRRVGLTAAHSPNAPSTWHHAPRARGRRRRSRRCGSNAPAFDRDRPGTHTIVGSVALGGSVATRSASGSMRPWLVPRRDER